MTISMTELKDTTGIVELCEAHDEPVFVTRNGYLELIVMSTAYYQKHLYYRDAEGKLDSSREYDKAPLMLPIKSLKNTGEVSKRCLGEDEPVRIVRNGREVLAIMSTGTYNRRKAEIRDKQRISSC